MHGCFAAVDNCACQHTCASWLSYWVFLLARIFCVKHYCTKMHYRYNVVTQYILRYFNNLRLAMLCKAFSNKNRDGRWLGPSQCHQIHQTGYLFGCCRVIPTLRMSLSHLFLALFRSSIPICTYDLFSKMLFHYSAKVCLHLCFPLGSFKVSKCPKTTTEVWIKAGALLKTSFWDTWHTQIKYGPISALVVYI